MINYRLNDLFLVCSFIYGITYRHIHLNPGHQSTTQQKKNKKKSSVTCSEVVARRKSHRLEFPIGDKLYPQIAPATPDVGGAVLAAVPAHHGGEAKGPIAHLDVVKLTLPGGLDGVVLLKMEVDALPWRGCDGREMWRETIKNEKAITGDQNVIGRVVNHPHTDIDQHSDLLVFLISILNVFNKPPAGIDMQCLGVR